MPGGADGGGARAPAAHPAAAPRRAPAVLLAAASVTAAATVGGVGAADARRGEALAAVGAILKMWPAALSQRRAAKGRLNMRHLALDRPLALTQRRAANGSNGPRPAYL